ncbi:hypothetical protein D9M71_199830 [compost metagenome]
MGQGEDIVGADLRAQQVLVGGQSTVDQVIAQQAELVHRKAVLGGKRRAVVVVVDQRQGHGRFLSKSELDLASCACRCATL